MSERCQIVLKTERMVRGKVIKPGTPLFEGVTLGGFNRADVDMAIQCNQVTVMTIEAPGTEPETVKKAAAEKAAAEKAAAEKAAADTKKK